MTKASKQKDNRQVSILMMNQRICQNQTDKTKNINIDILHLLKKVTIIPQVGKLTAKKSY